MPGSYSVNISTLRSVTSFRQLVIAPGGHFDAYVKGFDAASGQARDWFSRHLA